MTMANSSPTHESEPPKQKHFSQDWWQRLSTHSRWLILVCLIAGLTFRCINLSKVYWYDEAFTALRISSYTETEAVANLTAQKLVEPSDFQIYQQVDPNKGLVDSLVGTVHGLATEEPQHTPLYYIFARLWAGLFGSEIETVRMVSVLFSILALPCMAWLCWELYHSIWASWIGVILLAVSPFQVVYAQEARPVTLWITVTLLASATLLRAIRLNTRNSWVLYTLTLIFSFYSYLFLGLVAIAHVVYVLLLERMRWSKTLRRFVLALIVSLIAFLPWLIAVANQNQVQTVTGWLVGENNFTVVDQLKLWAYHLSLSFVDRGWLDLPTGVGLLFKVFQLFVRLAVLYALYLLCRQTAVKTWLFVISLTVVPTLILVVPDLLDGGKRSSIPRYLIPLYLGLELAMTYLLTQYLVPVNSRTNTATELQPGKQLGKRWTQRFWQVAAWMVITAGIVSSMLIAQSPLWWNKVSAPFPKVAQQINQTERPLIVSNAEIGDLMALSHYLDPKVRLLIDPACFSCQFNLEQRNRLDLSAIPTGYSDLFLFNPRPSDAWMSQLQKEQAQPQQNYQIKTLSEVKSDWYTEYWLWKLEPLN